MLCDDCVVDDTASFVEKDGECGRVRGERGERGWGEPFEERKCCFATEATQLSCNKKDKHECIDDGIVKVLTCSEPCVLRRRDLPSPEHDYGCRLDIRGQSHKCFYLTDTY